MIHKPTLENSLPTPQLNAPREIARKTLTVGRIALPIISGITFLTGILGAVGVIPLSPAAWGTLIGLGALFAITALVCLCKQNATPHTGQLSGPPRVTENQETQTSSSHQTENLENNSSSSKKETSEEKQSSEPQEGSSFSTHTSEKSSERSSAQTITSAGQLKNFFDAFPALQAFFDMTSNEIQFSDNRFSIRLQEPAVVQFKGRETLCIDEEVSGSISTNDPSCIELSYLEGLKWGTSEPDSEKLIKIKCSNRLERNQTITVDLKSGTNSYMGPAKIWGPLEKLFSKEFENVASPPLSPQSKKRQAATFPRESIESARELTRRALHRFFTAIPRFDGHLRLRKYGYTLEGRRCILHLREPSSFKLKGNRTINLASNVELEFTSFEFPEKTGEIVFDNIRGFELSYGGHESMPLHRIIFEIKENRPEELRIIFEEETHYIIFHSSDAIFSSREQSRQ